MRLEKWIAFAVMSGFLGASSYAASSSNGSSDEHGKRDGIIARTTLPTVASSPIHSITRETLAQHLAIPASLRFKAGVSRHFRPSFDITGASPHRYVAERHDEYGRLQKEEGFMVAHGIAVSSQTRLLECWYEEADVDKLSPLERYGLAPHVALHLRHAISGTLVNPRLGHKTTWYPTGLLFWVPPQCIYTVFSRDALIPMEYADTDLTEFRSRFYHPNPDFYQEKGLKQVSTYGPKEAIMPYQHTVVRGSSREMVSRTTTIEYPRHTETHMKKKEPDEQEVREEEGLSLYLNSNHEVAFFSHAIKDGTSYFAEIIGVFIRNGGQYDTHPVKKEETSTWQRVSAQYEKNGRDKKNLWNEMEEQDRENVEQEMSEMDEKRKREYADAAKEMAKTLSVPLYDWR